MYKESEFTVFKAIGIGILLILLAVILVRVNAKEDEIKKNESYADQTMVVTWEEINFRDGPGTYDTHILATLKRNTKVTATGMTKWVLNTNATTEKRDMWVEVRYGGRVGWIKLKALSFR